MYRTVQIVSHQGKEYQIPMTAQQAAFYLRMAEFKAATNPTITFQDVVLEKHEQKAQHKVPAYTR